MSGAAIVDKSGVAGTLRIAIRGDTMHGGQARYVAFGSSWTNSVAANGHWALPPDVEPLPERIVDILNRWLEKRHIAACDRGAALKGLRLGVALADLLLAIASVVNPRSVRNTPTAATARDARLHASLPRLRRSVFYRRARALQFKRNPVR